MNNEHEARRVITERTDSVEHLESEMEGSSRWRISRQTGIALGVGMAILCVAFADGLRQLFALWDTKEEYSHAYLLPAIAGFLVWQRKRELLARPWTGSWEGTGIAALGLLLFLLGTLSTIYAVIHYALVITIGGLLLALVGKNNRKYIWAPVVLLFFCVPFPQFLYQALSTKLQLLSSELGVLMIRGLGVSVFLEGNVIDLGTFKLQVIEACNGLRYLFPLASFGFLCAYLYRGPFWHKVLLVVSTVPITILMNSGRIAIIGVTVDRWGAEMAEGILHDFEGWAIFMACLAVLFGEIALLSHLQRPPRRFADTFFVEIPPPGGKVLGSQPVPVPYLAGLAFVVIVGVCVSILDKRQEVIPGRDDFATFPTQIGPWVGRSEPLEKIYIDALKFTDYVMMNFVRPDARPLNFYVAYYASQRAGESAHSPRSCIPGGGWKIEGIDQVTLKDVHGPGGQLNANRVKIAMGGSRQLVYYWFQQRGRNITNEYLVKWYLLWDSITRNRSDGALVRVSVTVPPGASWEVGEQDVREFLVALGSTLDTYVPN